MAGVTNRASFALGAEASVGVLPGSPVAYKYPLRGESGGNVLNYEESGEFTDDRLTTPHDLVSEDANFGFDVNMRCETFDPLIAAAFYNSWDQAPSRDNGATADSQITDVAASTGTFTVATGTAFVASQLIMSRGFTNSGNNLATARKLTGGSATTAVIGAGILTDESAPPAYAQIYVVGFEGASGDITATSTGLGSTALDFTTLTNLKRGSWIKIGGTGAGNRFATEALNVWVRVTAIAANAVTCDNLPSGWATDSGAGKTIKVFTTEILNIGDGSTKSTFFMQKKLPITGGAFRYMHLYGLHAGLFRMNTQARGRMTARFEYQGIRGDTDGLESTPAVAVPLVPRKRNVLVSGRSFIRLHEGGGVFASTVCVPNIAFEIQNQLIPVPCAHRLGYDDIEPGEAQCRISGVLNFSTESLFNKYRGSTETSISAVLQQDEQAYVIEAATGKLTQAGIELSGPNQIIQMPFTFTAHRNEGSITENKQYAWHRARYFEA